MKTQNLLTKIKTRQSQLFSPELFNTVKSSPGQLSKKKSKTNTSPSLSPSPLCNGNGPQNTKSLLESIKFEQLQGTRSTYKDKAQVGVEKLWLGNRTALAEDPDLVPSTHIRQFTTIYNSTCRGANILFWPLQTLHTTSKVKI